MNEARKPGEHADCCNDPCWAFHFQKTSGPCWGDTNVIDEQYTEDDYWWIHACEGHADIWEGGSYTPEQPTNPEAEERRP